MIKRFFGKRYKLLSYLTINDKTIYSRALRLYQPTLLRRFCARAITSLPLPYVYHCNVCDRRTSTLLRWAVYRDYPSCFHCGLTSRVRQIIEALSRELFGISIPLPRFPHCPEIVGCGLSDNVGYSKCLATKFNYRNTFYHQHPYLDITDVPDGWAGKFDFVIASDVFEHVVHPVDRAFAGLRALLKPSGFVVFSVPYLPIPETREYYPELYEYRLEEDERGPVLMNMTRDGRRQEFRNLVFHGGEGLALEMRLFGESDLLARFVRAGFSAVRVPGFVPYHGILDFASHSHLYVLRLA